MIFHIFTRLYKATTVIKLQNIFITPERNPELIRVTLYASIPLAPGSPNLLSVSMNLPILAISSQWNYTIYGLFCGLAFYFIFILFLFYFISFHFICMFFFTWHHVFKVYPRSSMYQYFIPFCG